MHVSFKLPEQATAMLDAYRDQVLTEAAEIAATVVGPFWHTDTLHEITTRLRAARTSQGSPVPDTARLREAVYETSACLEQLHDRVVFEYPDIADALQPLIDLLNRAGEQEDAPVDAARTGQEDPASEETGYVCGVCTDPDCGHCLGCTCEACDEARKYAETLASAEAWVLSAAQTRVANLPTNFSGSHIAASRLEVLNTITRTGQKG